MGPRVLFVPCLSPCVLILLLVQVAVLPPSSLSAPQVPMSLSCSFSSQCPHPPPCLSPISSLFRSQCHYPPPCPLLGSSRPHSTPYPLLGFPCPHPPLVPSCRCGTSPPKAASSCRGSGVVASPTCPGHQMAARSWRPPPRPCSGQLPPPTYVISALIVFVYNHRCILFGQDL